MIRIANGQGFWGDWLEAPVRLVEQGPIDYLILDYLAEVTMSIVQKQKQADPTLGYARDFPPLIGRIASKMKERRVRVVANAGGVNPVACAREVKRLAPELKVAVVLGDDVYDRVDDFLARGLELKNLDTGEPLAVIRGQISSANAYIGAFPLAEALATGADVVFAGRSTDTALALGPMVHEFGWRADQFDLLAAGTIAGHIVECGAQCTGGNCIADWQTIPDFANIGYPIIEAEPDGSFVITKHHGPDRVRVSGIKGRPATPFLKVSVSYLYGFKALGTIVYSWPDALEKAKAADAIVRARLAALGLTFEEIYSEYFGANACHGQAAPVNAQPAEVMLRVGVRGKDKKAVDRFTRELIPLVLNGPPTGTGYGDGRPSVREVVAYWPALIPREEIQTRVEVVE
jgi:hypothetical protein